jgi:phosphoribosylformimino-5-aminoimidazole carboxamide ribotide isomerase
MAFRPCIDLKDGRVVQIVGGTLTADGQAAVNHVSALSAADFADLYRRDGLRGGHVILLGPGNQDAACDALRAYPGGLQVGGGISPENATLYLDGGASHVIVTSFLFENDDLSMDRLLTMAEMVGKHRLVVDLSCRRGPDGEYYVATNRWQTVTATRLSQELIRQLEPYCDEFLVHAADVEGRQAGIDEELVARLGEWVTIPTTYAGGARSLDDIRRVEELSGDKVDLTIGSALDIFGGSLVRYADAARLGKTQSTSPTVGSGPVSPHTGHRGRCSL